MQVLGFPTVAKIANTLYTFCLLDERIGKLKVNKILNGTERQL